jgi:small subunit ribosomal protein S5
MAWVPKTELGNDVLEGKITALDEIFSSGKKIKEPEIVDKLLPNIQSEIVFIGGSPGKGGGDRRTPTRRTARMHRSGRRYKISALVAVGDGDKYLGIGKGSAVENRDAIEKATQNAKLNILSVRKGCGSWECACSEGHSIPVAVEGKKGSVIVTLKPAPQGLGLCISGEVKKVLRLAGIRDIWSKSSGETRSRVNYVEAVFNAFKGINRMRGGATEKSKTVNEEG